MVREELSAQAENDLHVGMLVRFRVHGLRGVPPRNARNPPEAELLGGDPPVHVFVAVLAHWKTVYTIIMPRGLKNRVLLGCVSRRGSKGQATIATVLGVITVAWIVFGQKSLHPNLAIVLGTIVLFASGLGLAVIPRRKH